MEQLRYEEKGSVFLAYLTPLNTPESGDDFLKKLKEEGGITTIIDPSAVRFIVSRGYQTEFGARPIKRAIIDYIINPFTSDLINGTINKERPIYISEVNNKIIFRNGTT